MPATNTAYSFTVSAWAAWAPALPDQASWQRWALAPHVLDGEDVPQATAMPAMLRRRAERLGKAALQTLYELATDYHGQPIVYASRYGELQRTLDLLNALADEGAVSPQQFSMAVHNAIAGLFMIAQKQRAPIAALASENALPLAALSEAQAQLADGAEEVWLLFCDEPPPDLFKPFAGNAPPCHAILLVLRVGAQITVSSAADTEGQASALNLLQFILNDNLPPLTLAPGWQLSRAS